MRIIIDGNGFAFRTMVSGREQLINVNEQNVTVIHGVIGMIMSIINQQDATEITFCWDESASLARRSIFPEYKAHRMETEVTKTVREQISILKNIMPHFGIKSISIPNIEADDIIAIISNGLNEAKIDCMIISSDKDLLQVVDYYSQLYSPSKNRIINYMNFESVMEMSKEGFVDYLCLLGDASDNIPGVPGIGEVTAKKLIKKYKNFYEIIRSENEIRMLTNTKTPDKNIAIKALSLFTQEGRNIFERNKKIIKLGYLLTYDEKKNILENYCYQQPKINQTEIQKFFEQYHLIQYLRNLPEIITCFNSINNLTYYK